MAYPTDLDTFQDPSGTSQVSSGPDHAALHTSINNAVEAIEAKLGVGSGTPVLNRILRGTGNGTATWGTNWDQANFGSPTVTGGTATGMLLGTNTITGGTVSGQLVLSGTVGGGVYGTALHQGGTVANASIGTPTIMGGTIAGSGTTSPISFGVSIAPTVGTLSDSAGGTFTPNVQAAQLYELTCGTTAGNRTFGIPTNPVNGQFLGYRVKQNAAATGTILFNSIYRFPSGGTPSLGTASTWTYMAFRYNSTDTKYDYQGGISGLI